MPTYKFPLAGILLVLISAPLITPGVFVENYEQSGVSLAAVPISGIRGGLLWLEANRSPDGFFGSGMFFEHMTAAASYALWLNNTHSSRVALSYSWLASSIDNSSNWFWQYYEADVPGVILYSVTVSGNLHLIQLSTVSSNLLQLQQSSGGFLGYSGTGTNTSSVDTAEALRGLINANAISATRQQSAVNYLFALQNPDGSFNLTNVRSYDPLYSQGPEPVSITALVLLALKDASYTSGDSHISRALNFISAKSSNGFAVAANDTNSVYAASLSALVFKAFGLREGAARAVAFLLSHQNSDGGFRDSIRQGPAGSNALDTGWAAIALQQVVPGPVFSPFLPSIAILGIIVGVGALVAVVGVVVYLVRRGRTRTVAPIP